MLAVILFIIVVLSPCMCIVPRYEYYPHITEYELCQVWQWILHQARLEDSQRVVSRNLVVQLTKEVMKELTEVTACQTVR